MSEQEQIKRIHEKLQQLLRRYELLYKENEKLRAELNESKHRSEAQSQKIHSLEQTVAVMRTISGKMEETDKKELEKRLTHYLKEIDRCISMMSQ